MSLASSGITVSAVKTALGVSNNNVGGLCTSTNVNEWSKWKPVSLDAVTMTEALLKGANYGITIKYATTASALLTAVQSNNNLGYVYNKPTGISTSPYRLGDFRTYNHSAICPSFSHYKDGDKVPINGVSSDYSVTLQGLEMDRPNDLDDCDYLVKEHLYPLSEDGEFKLQRGALITNGTYTYWSVGYIPWGNTYWQRFKGSDCTVLEFYTNLPSGTNSQNHTSVNSDRFYALPEPLHTITVQNVGPAGSKIAFPQYNTIAFVDYDYSKVQYNFCLSTVGTEYAGGTITNLKCGVCTDSAGTNILASRTISSSLTLSTEGTSLSWSGTFNITNTSPIVYFCIWYNNKLQHYTVPMQSPDDQ